MSENMLRPFWGELLENPAPLELSFNDCSYGCSYCFASLNGRAVKDADAKGTLRFITKVFSPRYEPGNLGEYLLRERHPIVLSNAVDPLSYRNLGVTRDLLPVLRRLNLPVILQTRGTREPEAFREVVDLLPKGSVVYMSITTFREDVLKQVEKGCPSNEQRLEMMAMAAEAGFACVAAFNPTVPDWMGDPADYVERCEQIAGEGTIKGAWYEMLHLTKRQFRTLEQRHPRGLPVVAQGPFETALMHEYDADWFDDLVDAIDAKGWRRFSHGIEDPVATLFELWPRPFVTYHPVVAECHRIYTETGKPVVVSFGSWASWVGDLGSIPLKRGDAWTFINQKQSAGQENRKALPERVTLKDALRFLWNEPQMRSKSIYGAPFFKAIIARPEGGSDDDWRYLREEDDGHGGDVLCAYAPEWGGEGQDNVVAADELDQAGYEVLKRRSG